MKFVMLPTWPLESPAWVSRGDKSRFMALPMPGQRVTDFAEVPYGDGSIYPFVMTMEQLCKWWHRVKKFTLTASHPLWPPGQQCELELDTTGTLLEEITMDMPNGWNNVGSGSASDWFAAGAWGGSFLWTDGLMEEHTASFSLSILRKPIAPHIDTSYYLTGDFTQIIPFIRLRFHSDGIDGVQAYADSAAYYDTAPGDHPDILDANGNASATLDGLALAMTAAFYTGSGFEDDPMTLTLTPSLFWEYRDADGLNPKYDSLTGAIL